MKLIPTLLILADDVTGAADCAARCKSAGLPATILIAPTSAPLPTGASALSSDSRHLTPSAAAARVQALFSVLQQAMATGTTVWYKKIDSTLRGNIGAELAAMLALMPAATARPCAVISPGFPAHGRGLVDGYLAYAQAPTQNLHLPTLLHQQTALPQAVIHLVVVRAGTAVLAATLADAYRAGAQLFIVDALTEADLVTLYQATQRALPHALFCGSAGLMGVIAAGLVEAVGEKTVAAAPRSPIALPLLAVVGSGSGMAQLQLSRLRQLSAVDRYEVTLDQSQGTRLLAGDGQHSVCVLHLPPPAPDAQLEGAVARQYAARLSAVGLNLIAQRRPRTLLLVGGDTAVHLLHALGVEQLTVEAELLPGMPLTTGTAADGQGYQIILKAGNHGDEETLVTLFSYSKP